MRTTISLTYPAGPQDVATMLADPAYYRAHLEPLGLEDAEVTVGQDGERLETRVTGQVPQERVPAPARRFVRSGTQVSLTQVWQEPQADGTRTGRLDVKVPGAPVLLSATTHLAPASSPQGAAATALTAEIDLTVSVPLIGRSIEARAMPLVERAAASEQRLASRWLAAHSR